MYFSIEFSAKGYWIILVIVRVVWSIYFPFKHSTNFDGILLSQFPFRRLSVELKDRLKLRSNNLPDRKGAREIWIWSDVRNFCHCQIFDAFAYQLWIFTSTLRADSACVNLTPAIDRLAEKGWRLPTISMTIVLFHAIVIHYFNRCIVILVTFKASVILNISTRGVSSVTVYQEHRFFYPSNWNYTVQCVVKKQLWSLVPFIDTPIFDTHSNVSLRIATINDLIRGVRFIRATHPSFRPIVFENTRGDGEHRNVETIRWVTETIGTIQHRRTLLTALEGKN